MDAIRGVKTNLPPSRSDPLSTQLSDLTITDGNPTADMQLSTISFHHLPNELLFKIFSYLATDDIARLSIVSKVFYKHCYNPALPIHQHLNLQPYWNLIDPDSIVGFTKRCDKIKALNLSWCGNNSEVFNAPALLRLLKPKSLTRLDLACCPLTDERFKQIILECPNISELDISSTLQSLSVRSLQLISALPDLTR